MYSLTSDVALIFAETHAYTYVPITGWYCIEMAAQIELICIHVSHNLSYTVF